jgi:hypothetical protein
MREEQTMKAFALIAATAAILSAGPAVAQTVESQNATGTIAVTGVVTSKCAADPSLDESIDLGELALRNGTVDTAFAGNVGGLSRTFTVNCTSPNPLMSVEALPLVNAAIATPSPGYTNRVDFEATLDVERAILGRVSLTDLSSVPGPTAASVGDHIGLLRNNVHVTVSNGSTADPTAGLEAGNYVGSILISIAAAI